MYLKHSHTAEISRIVNNMVYSGTTVTYRNVLDAIPVVCVFGLPPAGISVYRFAAMIVQYHNQKTDGVTVAA